MRKTLITGLVIMSMISAFSTMGQKIDTIVLSNGNIIKGEIKRLYLGILDYKTTAMGTVNVKWEHVIAVKSPRTFDISTGDRLRLFGSFGFSGTDSVIRVIPVNSYFDVHRDKIVEIYPLRGNFFSRIDGDVNIGYNYTKGSTVSQFNFSSSATYRGRKYTSTLSYSGIFTTQEERDPTRKQDGSFGMKWFLKKQWNIDGLFGAEQNSELGLDLRTLLSGGISRDLIHSTHIWFFAATGISANREFSDNFETKSNNLEGYVGLTFQNYKHITPKVIISVSGLFFPSLTVKDRYRVMADAYVQLEIISDLTFTVSFYDNYDSKPASEEAATNDWGITTSIGYQF